MNRVLALRLDPSGLKLGKQNDLPFLKASDPETEENPSYFYGRDSSKELELMTLKRCKEAFTLP